MAAAVAAGIIGAVTGCSAGKSGSDLSEFTVGDCLKLGGTAAQPEAVKASCASPESNFKVVAVVKDRAQCPSDVDSSYSTHNAISGSDNTVCLDVDWVIGGCMSVDPHHIADPYRVDCNDASVPNRQRATQILKDLDTPVSVDQCASGLGYTYAQRRFAVCVEDISGAPRN
ncbi:LppU family putative lipoprotein [Mycobacterium gordonae]|uniref:LppU family putative lipoprotein n=1 Tax=Mycobacterium gordonae TaxID=1778 RepID=UPI003B00138D